MTSSELQLVQDALAQVGGAMKAQAKREERTLALLAELSDKADEVEEKLPSFVERRQFWPIIGVVVFIVVVAAVGGLLIAKAIAGGRDDAIRRNACALRGVLSQAQSAGGRNPIPPGLDDESRRFVEDSRRRSAEFYSAATADIDATLRDLGGPPCPAPPTAT
jgi:hypothetical protein